MVEASSKSFLGYHNELDPFCECRLDSKSKLENDQSEGQRIDGGAFIHGILRGNRVVYKSLLTCAHTSILTFITLVLYLDMHMLSFQCHCEEG